MEQLANPTTSVAAEASSLLSDTGRHPVSALLDGLRQVVVATLRLVAAIVRFSSVTIPSTVYAVLHYSFTLQLNFPSLFFLFISSIVAGFVWLRYRHLNRYERLREEPLIKDEGFNLNPDVQRGGEDGERGNFHNYLDEFLQAIRIFGFLEKPVFHELARHLQTRRLVAGDSISLDNDSSFYIVVDGNVQVFAPLPKTAYGDLDNEQFEDEEHSGFQLLNEVQSGGTLSSLFTILRLFTEDVRLVVGQDAHASDEPRHDLGSGLVSSSLDGHRRSSRGPRTHSDEAHTSASGGIPPSGHVLRPGSSQLQLNAAALRNVPSAVASSPGMERGLDDFFTEIRRSKAASTVTDDATTVHQDESESLNNARGADEYLQSQHAGADLLPPAQGSVPFDVFAQRSSGQMLAGSGSLSPPMLRGRASGATTDSGRPATPGSILSGYSGTGGGHANGVHAAGSSAAHHGGAYSHVGGGAHSQSRSRKMSDDHGGIESVKGLGTIGRATVDTTLAVIPAIAFKRLTKRYPNAAAHIVQVILTRLSRVTFHTAHMYLGLTKEVMRTEKHINQIACYPLPSSFYEKGGIEKLRQRFLPEPQKQRSQDTRDANDTDDSFFTRQHHPERNVSGSEHTVTHRPRRRSSIVLDGTPIRSNGGVRTGDEKEPQTPWGHPDLPVRTPMPRTSVGPGDLFSMTGTGETGSNFNGPGSPLTNWVDSNRHAQKRPGSMQRDTVGSFMVEATKRSKERTASSGSRIGIESIEGGVKAESSFAETIGARDSGGNDSLDLRDEVMNCIAKSIGLAQAAPSPVASMHASPFMQPQDSLQRNMFKSAFGTLSMLDAAMYDDESSMTGHSSNLANLHHFDALENEIDIRFFEAGSVLAKSGERQAGLFYVIDGFLDVVVPPTDEDTDEYRNLGTSAPGASAQPTQKSQSREKAAGRRRSSSKSKSQSARQGPAVSTAVGNALDGTRDGRRPSLVRAERTNKGNQDVAEAAALLQKVRGRRALYTVGRGGIAGYLSSLLGSASYADIRAKTDVYVGFLPAHALARMMERRPIVMLTLCKRLLSLLSPLILHIDSALDWQQVNAGQVIYREGDPADSFYIVINGRLRSIAERGGGSSGVDVLSEHGQGDSVGELDVITRSRRRRTLHAIRDSELAKMPMTLFNAISVRHPGITIQISRIIAKRVRDEMSDKQRDAISSARRSPIVPRGLPDLGSNNKNLKTVAIVPVTRNVPVVEFSNRLQQAFDDTIGGGTAFLNQSSVMSVLGRHAFNRMGKLKLAGWLAEQEQKYRLVLYVVDTAVSSSWTQTSIRQADCILLVGFGDDPTMGEYERLLLGIKTTARKELVLLHPERSVPPGSTREWLKSRPWINAHHHVELPGLSHPSRSSTFTSQLPFGNDPTAVKALRNLKAKLETSLMRYRRNATQGAGSGRPHQSSDFARLARRLCGKSIGVVLGGGGARGCAHVGFLRALEERGIPVDMVGGTSIGSLVGGLYAKEGEMVSSFGRVKKFAGRMASLWRFVLDLTYPVVSYTSGFEFNRGVFKALGETHIEDMWLPYFCNTTNITWSRMEVHTSGYSWRYIRASMTLAGLIPPLVDEGNMLVDGGYLSNLPVNVMLAMGARDVFAVDVGAIDDTSPRYYGDTLSGWWVALNRYNPWSDARNIPSIPDIQGRLTYASSVQDLEEAKRTPGCRYLRMPVEMYGTMEFGKFTEIAEIGYEAARKALEQWSRDGELPTIYDTETKQEALRRRQRGGVSARRNSV